MSTVLHNARRNQLEDIQRKIAYGDVCGKLGGMGAEKVFWRSLSFSLFSLAIGFWASRSDNALPPPSLHTKTIVFIFVGIVVELNKKEAAQNSSCLEELPGED